MVRANASAQKRAASKTPKAPQKRKKKSEDEEEDPGSNMSEESGKELPGKSESNLDAGEATSNLLTKIDPELLNVLPAGFGQQLLCNSFGCFQQSTSLPFPALNFSSCFGWACLANVRHDLKLFLSILLCEDIRSLKDAHVLADIEGLLLHASTRLVHGSVPAYPKPSLNPKP